MKQNCTIHDKSQWAVGITVASKHILCTPLQERSCGCRHGGALPWASTHTHRLVKFVEAMWLVQASGVTTMCFCIVL